MPRKEVEEEPPPRTAKERRVAQARRKREERSSLNPEYLEGPAGDTECGSKKPDGGNCQLPAGFGTDHVGYGPCKYHMGSTPAGRKAGAYEMAGELMEFYGQPVDTNPIDALLDEVKRTAGHVQWLGARIAQFNIPLEEEIKAGKVTVKRPAGLTPEVEGWIRMYQSERFHLVKTAKACLDAGINQRLVDLAEHQGERLANAVDEILARLVLTPAQLARVPDIVPNVLRGLTGDQPLLLEGVMDDRT